MTFDWVYFECGEGGGEMIHQGVTLTICFYSNNPFITFLSKKGWKILIYVKWLNVLKCVPKGTNLNPKKI